MVGAGDLNLRPTGAASGAAVCGISSIAPSTKSARTASPTFALQLIPVTRLRSGIRRRTRRPSPTLQKVPGTLPRNRSASTCIQ